MRLTPGGQRLLLLLAALLALLIGFTIRTPLDRAMERGDYPVITNIEGTP